MRPCAMILSCGSGFVLRGWRRDLQAASLDLSLPCAYANPWPPLPDPRRSGFPAFANRITGPRHCNHGSKPLIRCQPCDPGCFLGNAFSGAFACPSETDIVTPKGTAVLSWCGGTSRCLASTGGWRVLRRGGMFLGANLDRRLRLIPCQLGQVFSYRDLKTGADDTRKCGFLVL